MANFVYNEAKRMMLAGELDWVNDDIRVLIFKTSATSPATERNANFLSDFTALVRYDSAGYADQLVSGRNIVENTSSNRAEGVAGNTLFAALGAPTSGQAIAAIYYKQISASDSQRIPLILFDSGFPFTGSGSDVTLRPGATGLITAS